MKSPSISDDALGFDNLGLKESEQLVRAYSDIANNRQFIANNWPHQTIDPNTPLRRFTTLGNLKKMLESKTNYLASVMSWDDVYEGLTRKIKLTNKIGNYIDWSSIQTSFFGQCWTMTQFDSELLWNARCEDSRMIDFSKDGDKIGVCIRSTFAKLVKSILPLISLEALDANNIARCGNVEYVDDEKVKEKRKKLLNAIRDSAGMVFTDSIMLDYLMIKRISFQDENEVRLVLDRCAIGGKASEHIRVEAFSLDVRGINYEIDPSDFIDEILLDPRIKKEDVSKPIEEITALVEKHGWKTNGVVVPVHQSDLYDLGPEEAITLNIPQVDGVITK